MSSRHKNGKDELSHVLGRAEAIHETKGIGGILASLLRKVFYEHKIGDGVFNTMCNDYIRSARRGLPTKVAQYLNRGNIRRQVAQPKITWKVFVRALRIMQVQKFVITIELKFASGRANTEHSYEVDISNPVLNSDLEERDKGQ